MASAHKDKSSDNVVENDVSIGQCGSPEHRKSEAVTEAQEYVESIMSGQLIHKVDTPTDSKRKRHLSISDASDTTPKKARNCKSGQETCSDDEGDNI